jgi:pimeloyl-ACP methyl ester carboxylesterase
LLLLHGVMAAEAMFDPLVKLLRDRFRMLVPDLRGDGRSGDLFGPRVERSEDAADNDKSCEAPDLGRGVLLWSECATARL